MFYSTLLASVVCLLAVGASRCVSVCVPVVSGPSGSLPPLNGQQFWFLGSQS